MKPTDFERKLTELDRDFESAASAPAVDARLRARLESARRVPFRSMIFAITVVLALITLGLTLRPANTLGGFSTREASPDLQTQLTADQRVAVTIGTVTLLDETQGAMLQVESGASLKRMKAGAEVFAGTVRFEVEHRSVEPYSVQVSGGVIEVVGTRFTVKENGTTGEVHLEQGVIRFRAKDGSVVTLAPGESVSWPPTAPPEPEPTPEPELELAPSPKAVRLPLVPIKPTPPPAPAFSVEAVLTQIASLRSRGQYEEAATVLSASLKETMPASTRERLSFELGSILSHQLHDAARACPHWLKHATEYPNGRYQQAVTSELSGLKCTPP
ncbi:MAG: FecR domain-containing protein [Archangium sp.]|nr:FecR domain-containing protein [Archangium sp.]